jgi:negative regulator of replication initiation
MIIKGIPAYWKITNNKKKKKTKNLKCIMLKTEFNLQRKWNLCVQNISAKK